MFQHPYRINELISDLEREFGGKFMHAKLNGENFKINGIKFNLTRVNTNLSGFHVGTGNKYTYFVELA
jgi:hypothetical protein